jgi:hypothetical protein
VLYLISLALLVTVVLYFLLGSPIPLKKRDITPQRLRQLVQMLYHRGADGADMRIRVQRDSRAMSIEKYIIRDNEVGLKCRFPLRGLSKEQSRALATLLTRCNAWSSDQVIDESQEFVVADCGSNTDLVTHLVQLFFADVLNVTLETDCFAYLTQIHPQDVRVGWSE